MVRRQGRALSVRSRILLSLIAASVIPILCLVCSYYFYNVTALRQDVEWLNISRVAQVKRAFETEYRSHHRFRQSLYDDATFLPLLRRGRSVDVYEALTLFRRYLGYCAADGEPAILDTARDRAYHRSGVSSGATYFSGVLGVDRIQAQRVRSAMGQLAAGATGAVVPMEKVSGERGLLMLYAMPAYGSAEIALCFSLTARTSRRGSRRCWTMWTGCPSCWTDRGSCCSLSPRTRM